MISYIVFVLSTQINNIESTEENNLFLYNNTSFLSDREQTMASTTKKFTSKDNRFSPYKRSNDFTKLQKNYKECNLFLENIDNNNFVSNYSYLETSAGNNNQSNVQNEWDIDAIITQYDFVIEREGDNNFWLLNVMLQMYILNDNSFSSDRINAFIDSVIFNESCKEFPKSRIFIKNYNKNIKNIVKIYIPSFLKFLETYNIDFHTEIYIKRRLLFLKDGLQYLYKFFCEDKVTMLNKDRILKTYVQLYIEIEIYFKEFNFENVFLMIISKIFPKKGNKKFDSTIKTKIRSLNGAISKIFFDFDFYRQKLLCYINHLKFKTK